MDNKTIKVALTDDHVLLNEALARIIGEMDGYQVTLQAENGQDLIRQLNPHDPPDLVVLDIQMPLMDGFQTAEWLREHFPAVYVMVLTMYDSDLTEIMLIQSGVRGVVKKNTKSADLRHAIKATMETGAFFSNARLLSLLRPATQGVLLANNIMLTAQEINFLKWAACDLTYKEIAGIMKVSPRTIDNYRDVLFEKLGVKSRVGLVRMAVKSGFVYEGPG